MINVRVLRANWIKLFFWSGILGIQLLSKILASVLTW